jgi:hypothetical protein
MSGPVDITMRKFSDGSPFSVAEMVVELIDDICEKTGKDAAEGTTMLLLAAMIIYQKEAIEPEHMPDVLPDMVRRMAKDFLDAYCDGARKQ